MSVRLRTLQARVFPHGSLDVVRQVALFAAAVLRVPDRARARGRPAGRRRRVRERARLIGIEHGLGLFVEPSVQAWARARAGDHRRARAGCTSTRRLRRDRRRARVHLPVPQRRASTSCATCSWSPWASRWSATSSTRPRRRASSPSGASSTRSPTFTGVEHDGQGQRAVQPLRGRAVDARLLRADDRLPLARLVQAAALQVVLGAVPARS